MLSTLFSSRWYFQATLIFELFSMPKISILDVWINYLLERLTINSLQGLNVYSILQHDTLVMSRDAVNKIVERMHTPIKRWGVHDVVCTVCSAPLGILRSPTKITHVCVVFVLRCKYVSKMVSPWMLVVFNLGIFIVEFWWTSNIGMATLFLEHGLANCASVIEDIALDFIHLLINFSETCISRCNLAFDGVRFVEVEMTPNATWNPTRDYVYRWSYSLAKQLPLSGQ